MRLPLLPLAKLACEVAYSDAVESGGLPALTAELREAAPDFDPIAVAAHNHALALVCRHGPVVVLAVRGTDPGQSGDVIDDCLAWQADQPQWGGLVHAGFAVHAQRLWARLEFGLGMHAAWQALSGAQRLVCAGHSLGGAAATLLAYRWARTFGRPAAAVTFGAPAVGNPRAAAKIARHVRVVRCVRGNDFVARLPGRIVWGALIPPAWLLWGPRRSLRPWRYAHPPGVLLHVARDGSWIVVETHADRLAVQVDQWLCRWDGFRRLLRIAGEVLQSAPWKAPGWFVAAVVRELLRSGGTTGIANHSARLYVDAAQRLSFHV